MRLRTRALQLVLLGACFLLPSALRAQGFGHISGTLTDPSGASVKDAQVTATRIDTGIQTTTVTDDAGSYSFPQLQPGQYRLEIVAPGFASFTQKNVVLQADQSLNVSSALKVGSKGEVVTVDAAPPQVDISSGTLSQVIDERRVNDLPLNGRNAAALTTLVPGVAIAPTQNIDQGITKTFPGLLPITVNGTRANQTNYMLDGGNNVDEYTNVNAPFPMPDVLQEFSIQTSNYNAEYGQNAGAIVNIVTKGGGNKFHGDAFEFVRNRVFNAANYFTYVGATKVTDPLKRNQFGGTINGPISIPHLYSGRDRSFFSFGVQSTRLSLREHSTGSPGRSAIRRRALLTRARRSRTRGRR
jgi:hypothetical protein